MRPTADAIRAAIPETEGMIKQDIGPMLRHSGGLVAEFVFVVAVLFGSLGIAVVVFVGMDALQGAGLAVFSIVLIIAAIHHRWYSRHRDEIESDRDHRTRFRTVRRI